jgi:hypothetical protein
MVDGTVIFGHVSVHDYTVCTFIRHRANLDQLSEMDAPM